MLLSFHTVTNDVFGAVDAGDCAFLIPVDTADECCKWQRYGCFCSKNASETGLMSQTLISPIPDPICAGSLPAVGSDALFYPALFTEVLSAHHELFLIFPPAWEHVNYKRICEMLNITAAIHPITNFPLTQNFWKHGCGDANSLTSVAKAINWSQPQITGTEVFAKLIKILDRTR